MKRRLDERFSTHSGVTIRNPKQASGLQAVPARDISLHGGCLNTRERPTFHDLFEVRIQDAIFPGKAVYVRVGGRAWLVGIRLIKETLIEKELRNAIQPFTC